MSQQALYSTTIVPASQVALGDVLLAGGEFVWIDTAVDVIEGQDGYVSLRGHEVYGRAVTTLNLYPGELVEVVLPWNPAL